MALLTVDSRGKRCPIPIIDLAKALATIEIGATIVLLSDDPATHIDVQAWCRMTGNELTAHSGDHFEVRRIT